MFSLTLELIDWYWSPRVYINISKGPSVCPTQRVNSGFDGCLKTAVETVISPGNGFERLIWSTLFFSFFKQNLSAPRLMRPCAAAQPARLLLGPCRPIVQLTAHQPKKIDFNFDYCLICSRLCSLTLVSMNCGARMDHRLVYETEEDRRPKKFTMKGTGSILNEIFHITACSALRCLLGELCVAAGTTTGF